MPNELPVALQLCPFSAFLEAGLSLRFEVIRWFKLDEAAQSKFLVERANTVRAVVSGGHIGCPNELMSSLPKLGVIAINGVGLDKVDLPFATSRGVAVGNTPGVLTEDVADLAVGLIIDLLRGIAASDAYVKAGKWPGGDRPLGRKVSGRRFGIVGLGRIGQAIAARLAPFGPVSYTGPKPKTVPFNYQPDLLQLARDSEVLVVACPATSETRKLIGDAVFEALGKDGYLVNVSRGSVVDEPALVAALRDGRIAGAALDVFENEPEVPAGLRTGDRTVLTPHIASATVETRVRMADMVLANLDAWRSGKPLPTAAN
ncbi:MAG: 2-hydroxyacid dehydrogenase [Steroidobacteraceae bacterium]